MATVRYFVMAVAGTLLASTQLGAQGAGAITGRVVDSASSQPVAAVTVRIEGTARGAVTGDDGTYMLGSVPVGPARVRAARIGYAPQVIDVDVTAGAPVTANFTLSPAGVILEQVVTTGYGTQRREAITGSVAVISADDANVGVITNPNEMIQGRVAGVLITENNGEPGAGAQIRIRGGTSISASNEPLYVIDGVPINNAPVEARGLDLSGGSRGAPLERSPLATLNPSDIQTITILKDASATAIYGSRAANGVVLIETKKGSAAGGSTIEYDGYVAMSTPSSYLELMSGPEYESFMRAQLDAVPRAGDPDFLASRDTVALREWTKRVDELGTADTDWERELTRSAVTHNHNLSFSGGREDTRYRASLNYMDQEGVVIDNGLTRLQGRLNASHNAFEDKLRLGLNLTASHLDNDYIPFENTGGFEGAVFTNVAIYNPTHPVRVSDGAFFEIPGQVSVRNPVALALQVVDRGKTTRALGNVTGELDLLPGLTARVNVGADRSESIRQTYLPRGNPLGSIWGGRARQVERSLTTKTLQTLLTYRNEFDIHGIDVVGGYEFNEYDTDEFGAEARNFVTDLFSFNNLGGGEALVRPFSTPEQSRLVSFFGRANYSFNDRYYLTGVLRYDGASQFGAGNKWALFPAVSASWRVSESGVLPSYFSELRLRAGWGRQGNAAVRPYQSLLLLGTVTRYSFGNSQLTGVSQTQNPNPNLRWEETEQYNVAVDYGLLNNRFTGSLEYYIKNTEDLLLEILVPQPAVVGTRLENIGKLKNSGLEFSLDALAVARQHFTWQAGLVLTAEQNEVEDLGGRTFITTGDVSGQGQSNQVAQRIMPGHPLGTFYGPVFVGVDTAGKQLFKCGTASTACVNGRTTSPSANDYEVLGDANPDFTVGLRSQINWRKFDASFLIRGAFGQEVFNNGALVYATKGNALQSKNFFRSALTDPIGITEPAIFSSLWIEDGSFIRMQNLTLGYTLDIPMIVGGTPRPARVYVSADNLFLITDYNGYDPEVHTEAGLASRGIDYLSYPRPRTFTAGIRVQF